MSKKETFEFWDRIYAKCPKCGYSYGSANKNKICPTCNIKMVPLSNEEKEYMYTIM